MAESKTTERAAEQAFQRAEDTIGTMFENNRRNFQVMLEFQRNSINTSVQFARDIQEESLRLTDAWFDQMTKFQKNTFKTFQDYTSRYQDYTEKTVKDSQNRMEQAVDQTLELVTPTGARGGRR